MIKKNFLKQIRIYKTFKFSLFRASSFLLYKKIIKIAYLLKFIKENIEYIPKEEIEIIKKELLSFKDFDIAFLPFIKSYFVLNIDTSLTTVELIIDKDMQPVYDVFKRFDRIKNLDEYADEKKIFIEKLDFLENKLLELTLPIPEKKMKKIRRFYKFVEEIDV